MNVYRLSRPLRIGAAAALMAIQVGTAARAHDFMNNSYQSIAGTYSWHEAKADAEARGGHLATITSQAEYDYVSSLGVLPDQGGYWLGATDEVTEGVWIWVTGEPFEFDRWRSGEPNNSGPENFLIGDRAIEDRWNDVIGVATPTIPFYLLEIESTHCSPHKARATPQVVNGFLVGATITDPGCGYTNAPAILIQGGGGTGATALAVVVDGRVASIHILSAGCCYTNLPGIQIASPPFVPTVGVRVGRVVVTQNVVLGRRYSLDCSSDLTSWTETGPPFTAESETIENEFDVDVTGRYFRIREVP